MHKMTHTHTPKHTHTLSTRAKSVGEKQRKIKNAANACEAQREASML